MYVMLPLLPLPCPVTMVRRTKEEAAATRAHLLDTAERVFAERGVSRASLQDIAAAAGVTRGAIYWHFKDKAELYLAMVDRVCLPCEVALESLGDDTGDRALAQIEQRLRESLLYPLRQLRENEQARRVFTILLHRTEYTDELAGVLQRHRDAVAGCMAGLEALLRQGQARGLFRADLAPAALARALMAQTEGLLLRATVEADPEPAWQAAQAALDVWLAGLRRGSAGTPP